MDIEHVLENGNCHQCGVCVGVCPTNAITIEQHRKKGLYPVFHRSLCTDCDLCHIACPGDAFDWNQLQRDTFGEVPADKDIGYAREYLSGYTKWQDIRVPGASGGVATAVLIALLEKGEIDGAVVVKMHDERPLEPHVYIARTREEIIAAQQSKYIPVPTGLILKEINKTEGRFALVGLPCHIQGIRLAQQKMPRLRKRITLMIGLICGFHPSFTNTTYLVRRAGVPTKDFHKIKEIKYRDLDWPGGFNVMLKDGTNKIIHPVQDFFWAHAVFERQRCITCTDAMAEFADIVVGDEWRGDGLEREDFKDGWSYIVNRTERGSEVIEMLTEEGVLHTEDVPRNIVKLGALPTINLKKRVAYAAIKIRKAFGLAAPNYGDLKQHSKPKVKHYIGALLMMTVSRMFENHLINTIFLKAPTKLMSQYFRPLYKSMVDVPELTELKDPNFPDVPELHQNGNGFGLNGQETNGKVIAVGKPETEKA